MKIEQTPSVGETTAAATSFVRDGYVHFPNLFSSAELTELRAFAFDRALQADTAHRERYQHHGSIIPADISDHRFQRLLTGEQSQTAFQELGFTDSRWLSGYVISKYPASPRLWWHQDWFAWGDPVTERRVPLQMSLMIYLTDTDASNGALRVIPGSHRAPNRLHELLPDAHGEDIERLPSDHPAYQDDPGEVTVTARAGDIIACDIRLLHATHSNQSPDTRHCLTLWFLPNYLDVPDRFRSYYSQHPCQPDAALRRKLGRDVLNVLPDFEGIPRFSDVKYQRRPSNEMLARMACERQIDDTSFYARHRGVA